MVGSAAVGPLPELQAPPTTPAAGVCGESAGRDADDLTLFLCGDVMLGRGIDQILARPSDPRIYEPAMSSALGYVELAERANGPIPRSANPSYVWGDALDVLQHARPDLRIVNLETAITRSGRALPKGINYRMSPDNVSCLTAAQVDCCVLANNHVLDWGPEGLVETLKTLESVGIRSAGAGLSGQAARAPAILEWSPKRRVLVFAHGSTTSGIPRSWAAREDEPGVNLLDDLSSATAARIADQTASARRAGDILIASIHWGANWGYDIPDAWRRFAHRLIDDAGIHMIHGHSSHHPKGIELYKQKLILYGCGDFLNDYEGIAGCEAFRSDLVVMYLPKLSVSNGRLLELTMVPFQIRNFRLNRATRDDAAWLYRSLARESAKLGAQMALRDSVSMGLILP